MTTSVKFFIAMIVTGVFAVSALLLFVPQVSTVIQTRARNSSGMTTVGRCLTLDSCSETSAGECDQLGKKTHSSDPLALAFRERSLHTWEPTTRCQPGDTLAVAFGTGTTAGQAEAACATKLSTPRCPATQTAVTLEDTAGALLAPEPLFSTVTAACATAIRC